MQTVLSSLFFQMCWVTQTLLMYSCFLEIQERLSLKQCFFNAWIPFFPFLSALVLVLTLFLWCLKWLQAWSKILTLLELMRVLSLAEKKMGFNVWWLLEHQTRFLLRKTFLIPAGSSVSDLPSCPQNPIIHKNKHINTLVEGNWEINESSSGSWSVCLSLSAP